MTSEMQPALDEIAAIYKKHGLGGAFTITNGTTMDYKLILEAPFSCFFDHYENGQLVAVRLRCKPEEIPSREERAKRVHSSVAMLAAILQCNLAQNEKCQALMRMAAKHVNITTRIDDLEG